MSQAHLSELVDPKIREHHGRIVKITGDGVLAEFASQAAYSRQNRLLIGRGV
jgi:class 3 adenylate cyclase